MVWPKWMKVWKGNEVEFETDNMLCSSVPTAGLAGPLEKQVQMFYVTEEPKYTLNVVSG